MEDSSGAVVAQLAAGEAHTLALTENGSVYSWGRGMFGRLGTGKELDEPSPVHISFTSDVANMEAVSSDGNEELGGPSTSVLPSGTEANIVSIAAGAYHSLALAEDGTIWSWGYNACIRWTDGQLGRDGPTSKPGRVTRLKGSGACNEPSELAQDGGRFKAEEGIVKAVAVGAGGMMSCVIDEDGGLWFWDAEKIVSWSVFEHPDLVREVNVKSEVLKVACGSGEHVLALVRPVKGTASVACYAWGDNRHGQLGVGHKLSMPSPQLLSGSLGAQVDANTLIACGAYHSVVVTLACITDEHPAHYESEGSVCWTFGQGENGQLGHGTTANSALPQPVQELPLSERVVAVDCGLFHTSLELSSGSIWAWGMEGGFGLCPGMGTGGDALAPVLLFRKQVHPAKRSSSTLVCGAAHTVALDCNGLVLWAWGRGQHGALGRGELADSWVPCQVKWPPAKPARRGTCDPSIISDVQPNSEVSSRLEGDPLLRSLGDKGMVADSASRDHENALYAQSLEEIHWLKAELCSAQSRANLLHYALYGGSSVEHSHGPVTTGDSSRRMYSPGSTAISKSLLDDWEKDIAQASDENLAHLEGFYRSMRGKVKDVMLQRKIEAWCRLYPGPAKAQFASVYHHGAFDSADQGSPQGSYTKGELESLSQKLRRL